MGKKEDEEVKPRQVAVAIPFFQEENEIKICLVSSRKHDDRYVLPKGGIEKGEKGYESAVREMWEEAGLQPTKEWSSKEERHTCIGSVDDHKPHKHSSTTTNFIPRATYTAFLIEIKKGDQESELEDWPEKHERKRVWMSFDDACKAIEWRKDIFTLLQQSKTAF